MNHPNSSNPSLSYREAGVDIDAGDRLVENIKPFAKKTMRDGVLAGIGGFAALFEVSKRFRNPVLVSGTDGVGTKLKLAFELNRHDTIGIDLVAMSVNDILVQGAEPLFFLDYFACGKLDVNTATQVIKGIAHGCELAGCALVGGETAEMPGMYSDGEYDLAGFVVGAVEKDNIINGSTIAEHDVVLGLASSGAHSNGYSLIRKILSVCKADLGATLGTLIGDPALSTKTLGEALLEPTRIYVKPMLALMQKITVKGIAHITGGGLVENIPRILPEDLVAILERASWPQTALFSWLQRSGNVDTNEMERVFNCGIGMTVVVAPQDVNSTVQLLTEAGETVFKIGKIQKREPGGVQAVVI